MKYSVEEIAKKANVSNVSIARDIIKGEFYYDNYEMIELTDEELKYVIKCIKDGVNINTIGIWRKIKYKDKMYFIDNVKYED